MFNLSLCVCVCVCVCVSVCAFFFIFLPVRFAVCVLENFHLQLHKKLKALVEYFYAFNKMLALGSRIGMWRIAHASNHKGHELETCMHIHVRIHMHTHAHMHSRTHMYTHTHTHTH